MAAAGEVKKVSLLSMEAANLELRSEVIAKNADPDALGISLEEVASLRSAIAGRRGLQLLLPMASTMEHIIKFITTAFADGLPEPTEDSHAAWRLLATSIACGFELGEICPPAETIALKSWTNTLHICAATLDTLKAQLQLICL